MVCLDDVGDRAESSPLKTTVENESEATRRLIIANHPSWKDKRAGKWRKTDEARIQRYENVKQNDKRVRMTTEI